MTVCYPYRLTEKAVKWAESREKKDGYMLLREAGKRENGEVHQCFPRFLLPDHIPNVVFRPGELEERTGK